MAAYRTLDLPELELKTLEAIATFGARGCTQDEILDRFPSFTNETLTPRFAPLERKGLMYRAGDTRKGKAGRQQKIMRVVEHLATVPMLPPTKKKRNPYVKGMMDAAKIIMKCTDLKAAKAALASELRRVAV